MADVLVDREKSAQGQLSFFRVLSPKSASPAEAA
jgi:hypothetical protein